MENIITHLTDGSAYNFIQNIALGFQKSQILFVAMKYDLFSIIEGGHNTAELITSKLSVNQDAMTRLLDALVAMELLTKNGLYYHNSDISKQHLTADGAEYYGFLLHNADLWHSWSDLYNTVKTGATPGQQPIYKKDNDFIEDFIIAEDWQNKLELRFVINEIKLSGAKKILKLGAAGFRYPLEIAKQNPDIEVHILDSDNIIGIADRLIRREYDCKNIKFIAADYKTDKIETDYDIVLLDSMLEGHSVTKNIERLQIIYKFIKNGGRLVLHQHLISDCRTKPLAATLRSLTLLLNTKSGSAYTYSDLWVTLKEANFKDVSAQQTEAHTHIITATKSIIG